MTDASMVDRALVALADTHRRRAVELLGQRPRSAGELALVMGLSPPAMSRHLRALRTGGLVEESHPESDARVRIYRLRREPFQALDAWVTDLQLAWGEQLEALKAHLEADDLAQRGAE